MKFKANTRRRAIEYEKDLVKQWKKNRTFEKSVEMRPARNAYVFYDGPPFITGVPHHGTLLSSIVKDAVPRFWTMKGKRVERVWGWDTHGLPAENFVEKKLGITDRHEIGTKIRMADYITTARESMIQTGGLWEETVDRIGRWVDFRGAYKTMDKDYMESVWWAFKELYDKGKIYEGERVLMYDTKWATPLSKAEVTMDTGAYVEVTDPSVYVKFELERESVGKETRKLELPVFMLAWTTTPWTLPANTALAVNPKLKYLEVRVGKEVYIMAKNLAEKVLVDEKKKPIEYEVLHEFTGERLLSRERKYHPLFEDRGENAHKLWAADYVEDEAGTGVVHLAPAYGEEDFELAKDEGIPIVHVLDEYGVYTEGEWQGKDVWKINKTIAKTLLEQGKVWKIDYILHEYPHNPRTGNRLMYRAHPSWFMDIDGQRTEMLEQNTKNINWFPDYIKHGRFEKTVQSAPDWNLSRDRFWATAMPVWKGADKDGNELIKVIGSYAELKELSGKELDDYHRPWVDDITFEIDGVKYTRIDKVMDCWFESGSMPFAQFHYPFENVEKFEQNFPGDFIVEYVGQVRAWFYYMHAINVGLFGQSPFKNAIVTGNIAGNDGRKMSKSYGNFTDPQELMDEYSADSLRFLLLQSPVLNGEDFALHDKEVGTVARKLSMVWNMYDFFTMYAEVDGWEWDGNLDDPTPALDNPLDQWIVSRVHQLTEEIGSHMEKYDLPNATKPILEFLEDASNWYVRRSRKRFWKTDNDGDKDHAYRTLHYVLVQLSIVMAPFTPFLADELYQKLTGGESVHLVDWPEVGHINVSVLESMNFVREMVNDGLSQRASEGVKVRQPLANATITNQPEVAKQKWDFYESIILEELNVKKLSIWEGRSDKPTIKLDFELTPELKREGLMREIVRHVQNARKKAELNVDDRIELSLGTADEQTLQAIKEHQSTITAETLATTLHDVEKDLDYHEEVKVEGQVLQISLSKA